MIKHVSFTDIETKVPLGTKAGRDRKHRRKTMGDSYRFEDGAGSKLAELLQLADCED